jgi:hypothetical protein
LGTVCLSGKLGYIGVVPILIEKPAPEPDLHFSLALSAFLAFNNATVASIDWQEKAIHLLPAQLPPIRFSEKRRSIGGECPVNDVGDATADLIIGLTPADVIRDNDHTISYDLIISADENDPDLSLFENKVVFIGERSKRERFKVFDFTQNHRYGVELHADSFKTIQQSASGEAIVRPLSTGYQALLMIVLIVLGAGISFWIKPSKTRWRYFLLIGIPIAYTAGIFYMCITQRVLIDWLYHLAGFFFSYFLSGRIEKKWFL